MFKETSLPSSYETGTQSPLEGKGKFVDLIDMKNTSDCRALRWYKNMPAIDMSTGTKYVWKESVLGVIDGGYTYPKNIVSFGIDYSEKTYNFVVDSAGLDLTGFEPGDLLIVDSTGSAVERLLLNTDDFAVSTVEGVKTLSLYVAPTPPPTTTPKFPIYFGQVTPSVVINQALIDILTPVNTEILTTDVRAFYQEKGTGSTVFNWSASTGNEGKTKQFVAIPTADIKVNSIISDALGGDPYYIEGGVNFYTITENVTINGVAHTVFEYTILFPSGSNLTITLTNL